jgi:hypothetical protein
MPKLIVQREEIRREFAHLVRTEDNARLYQRLSNESRFSDISADAKNPVPPGYRLLRIDPAPGTTIHEFEVALLSDVDRSVVYYNQVSVTGISDLNCRPATQMLVWRSQNAQHQMVLRDVAKNVFFNYILERYDVILSDNNQTAEGKFFWQRQMSLALALGMHVYYYQMLNAALQPIKNQAALNNLEDQLWAEEDNKQYHLALISKIELPADLLIDVELNQA